MSPLIMSIILVAAVSHAGWNALLKGSDDPLDVSTRALMAGTVLSFPPVLALWVFSGRPGMPVIAWLLVLISALVEVGYFVFLSTAYRRGELPVVWASACIPWSCWGWYACWRAPGRCASRPPPGGRCSRRSLPALPSPLTPPLIGWECAWRLPGFTAGSSGYSPQPDWSC